QIEQASQYYYAKEPEMYNGHAIDATGTIVRPVMRARYDSPPSPTDIPDLQMSRSGTVDSISSGSSYTSQGSRSGTPLSSGGSYTDELEHGYLSRAYSASPGPHVVRDIVHVPMPGEKHGMLPYEIEREEVASKPKKAKVVSGNIFMRFLNGSSQPRS